MGNEHAAVLIVLALGTIAMADNGDTLMQSIKGEFGTFSRLKVLLGVALAALVLVLLLPAAATALSLLHEWIPETPAVVSSVTYTQG